MENGESTDEIKLALKEANTLPNKLWCIDNKYAVWHC